MRQAAHLVIVMLAVAGLSACEDYYCSRYGYECYYEYRGFYWNGNYWDGRHWRDSRGRYWDGHAWRARSVDQTDREAFASNRRCSQR